MDIELTEKPLLALVHGDDSSGAWMVAATQKPNLAIEQPFHFINELDSRYYRYDPTSRILYHGDGLMNIQTGWRIAGYGRIPREWGPVDFRHLVVNFFRSGEYRKLDTFVWGTPDV